MSVSGVGSTTQNIQLPPVPQKAATPAETSATEAAEKTAAKPEAGATQSAQATQASSRNTPNPALKVNPDGTVGPHHKPRHPHGVTQGASQATPAQPQRQPETLPGNIKV